MSLLLSSRLACVGLLVALALPLTACGKGDGDPLPQGGGRRGGASGPYVGREIWLTYDSPPHAGMGIRVQRPREEARTLAEDLRAKVLKGADIAVLAQMHSNAPGARADGFSGILPVHPQNPDERDRAMMRVPVGGVTDLVDWNGGWWFAKRVTPEEAQTLEKMFRVLVEAGKEANKFEVRARAIVFSYVGSYPWRFEVTDTLDQAKAKAWKVLRAIQQGADFDKVAREGIPEVPLSGSWDLTGEKGGALVAYDEPGKGGRWIRRYDSGYPNDLLKRLFEEPVGLVSEPIETKRGVVVAEVLERRKAP
jgi:hypothetical protein